MTRSLDAAAVGAVTAGHAPYLFFIQLDFSQPLRVCSAGYDVDWNGRRGWGSVRWEVSSLSRSRRVWRRSGCS